jgi:hypothetical protein
MGLAALTDALSGYLTSAIAPAPALVGATYPAAAKDLPAVVVSLTGVQQRMQGVGRLPAESASGALPVTTTVNLADPVATLPDAIVPLLSGDRLTLTLPHGPLVAADGTTTFGAGDPHVTLGPKTFNVVASAPKANDVQPDPDLGVLHFGAPLPATGNLIVAYFVGVWEVRTERYQGILQVEAFATDVHGVDTLSRSVEAAFLAPAGVDLTGLAQIAPTSWQAIEEAGPNRAHARSRTLGFSFDYELIEPHLAADGGLISTISVGSTFGAEHFDVQREGSTP